MKLWVDDERPAPEEWDWVWVKTSAQALWWLENAGTLRMTIDEIALDHDLGGEDTTRPVVLWLAEHGRWPAVIRVHTANPPGREWLEGMIERYGPGVTR